MQKADYFKSVFFVNQDEILETISHWFLFLACDCDVNGSVNASCNYETGQCHCKPNVVGRACNQCAAQHYGLSSNSGCIPCACQPLYSISSQCDANGYCHCKEGVGSAKCDQCAPGYYDLTLTGMEMVIIVRFIVLLFIYEYLSHGLK